MKSTTSRFTKGRRQTFARSYALDIDETAAVENEAAEALIATHVSWQLGSLESLLPEPSSLAPLATKTTYVRRRLEPNVCECS